MTVSMSTVWDRTAEFLSEHMGAIIGIALTGLFVPSVVGEILTPLNANAGPALKLGLGLLGLLLLLVTLWGQLALTALTLAVADGAGAARVRAIRRLGPFVLVMIALLVIALVLAVPALFIMIGAGVDVTRLNQPGVLQNMAPGAAGMVGIYILIAIPVALWLMARLAIVSTAVVVAEDVALGALRRSFRLTRGLALRIIGVLLLYGIVMWVATLAVETVVGALLGLMLEGAGPITTASVLTATCVALVGTIFSTIAAVYAAKLYLAARDREAAPAA